MSSKKRTLGDRVYAAVVDYYVDCAPPNTTLETVGKEADGILWVIDSWMEDNWRRYEEDKDVRHP